MFRACCAFAIRPAGLCVDQRQSNAGAEGRASFRLVQVDDGGAPATIAAFRIHKEEPMTTQTMPSADVVFDTLFAYQRPSTSSCSRP